LGFGRPSHCLRAADRLAACRCLLRFMKLGPGVLFVFCAKGKGEGGGSQRGDKKCLLEGGSCADRLTACCCCSASCSLALVVVIKGKGGLESDNVGLKWHVGWNKGTQGVRCVLAQAAKGGIQPGR
jgi:hypothetical protein